MVDNILDFLPFNDVYHYYAIGADNLSVVQKILTDQTNSNLTDDEALEIAKEIVLQVKIQDLMAGFDVKNFSFNDFEGNNLQEVIERVFDALDRLCSYREKMFILHLLYYSLHCSKSDFEDFDNLTHNFFQYYSAFYDRVEFSEYVLKDRIRHKIKSFEDDREKSGKFILTAYKEKLAEFTDIEDFGFDNFICIAAALIYRNRGLELTPEQAVSLCKENTDELNPMHEAVEYGRANSSDNVVVAIFVLIIVIGVILAICFQLEEILAIAVVVALIVFVIGIGKCGLSVAEQRYQHNLENIHEIQSNEPNEEHVRREKNENYA